jgi:hypothetical protein
MSFTFDVINANQIDTRHATQDAWKLRAFRDDTVRLIWSKSIFPVIFREDFIKNLVMKEAHTSVFSFDVPTDHTINWNTHRHIAMFQNFPALAGHRVRCVPWQIRVEFATVVRPYIYVRSTLLKEISDYLRPHGWMFTTTDEGFLLIPLSVYEELEQTHEMYEKFWEVCKTVRGPSVCDMSWGDDEFKAILDDEDNAIAAVEQAFVPQAQPNKSLPPPSPPLLKRSVTLEAGNGHGSEFPFHVRYAGGSNAAATGSASGAAE